MKSIGFIGNVDKRIVTLNVARGLQFLGETLIITDDPNYLRGTVNGVIGNVKVLLVTEWKDDIFEKYDDGTEYVNVIYDSREFIPKGVDKTLVFRGKDRKFLPESILNYTDDIDKNGDVVNETTEIVITYFMDKKELKKTHYTDRGEHSDILGKAELIELKPLDFKWLMLCEETGNINVMKNTALYGVLSKLTHEVVDMSEKEWSAVMTRA